MRKRNHFRQLSRSPSHKMAMLRNMVTSLIEHERIVTTVAKAKEVQRLAEKIITISKRATIRASNVLVSKSKSAGEDVTTPTPTTAVAAVDSTDDGKDASIVTDTDLLLQQKKLEKQHYILASSQLVHAYREIGRIVRTDYCIQKVMNILRHRYDTRTGGYTRILKLSQPRSGDNANMAIIEYVDHNNEVRAARPPPPMKLNDDGTPTPTINNNNKLSSIQLQQQLETLKNLHITLNKR